MSTDEKLRDKKLFNDQLGKENVMSKINHHFMYSGVGHVWHDVRATDVLPKYLKDWEYERAYVVSSKTLNTKTDVIQKLTDAMGDRVVAVTDRVGEHAPMKNIITAANEARDLNADVIVGVGGGSIIDFTRMMQLCLAEGAYTKEDFYKHKIRWDGDEPLFGAKTPPKVRQLIIPTTLATAEWTLGGTPVDEETKLKTLFIMRDGGPELVIYDPEILLHTPLQLLLSTGVRGLDHAINTRCSAEPHPKGNVLTLAAIKLWIENLPRLKKDKTDLEALNNAQLACWYTGICQQSAMHGFSHFMVHVLAPYVGISHSDAACVLMLAQAKWLEGWAEESHGEIKEALGRPNDPLHVILKELLDELEMPTTLNQLGVEEKVLDELIEPALDYKLVTKFNVRPIKTGDDIRRVMETAWE